jgi:hypothetical protein
MSRLVTDAKYTRYTLRQAQILVFLSVRVDAPAVASSNSKKDVVASCIPRLYCSPSEVLGALELQDNESIGAS